MVLSWAFYNASGQLLETTDGAWQFYNSDGEVQHSISAASSPPGGVDTQVQFNDSGALGGDAGLVYNKTTDKLTIGSEVEVPRLRLTLEVISPTTEVTMSGTLTLVAGTSTTYQYLDPNGSDRDVNLPAETTGLTYLIAHIGGANILTIKDNGGGTLHTLNTGEFATFIYSGTAWRIH
jgi:hypothetical protein